MARPPEKDAITWYNEAKQLRSPHENDWRMSAAYCLPRHYASWLQDGPSGQYGDTSAARRFAYDSTGVNALPKYASILNRLATPESQRWCKLQADNTELMKLYHVRAFFDTLNDKLFKMRYAPRARFQQTVGEAYTSIGVYGMGPYSITWRKPSPMDKRGGFAYKAWPLKDIFILVDDAGIVTAIFRRFFLNARQYRAKFPEGEAPPSLAAELKKAVPSETAYFEFVHMLHVRDDYVPNALDARRHPICESYLCVKDSLYVGDEKGFQSFPLLTPRTFTEPGDLYGYAVALQAMPAMGGVSSMKKTVLKQGQKAVDPVILANDDGVLSGRVDLRPGRVNYGGIDSAGRKMIGTLDGGNFQVAEKLIEDERGDIRDAFLGKVFAALVENPDMTVPQTMQLIAEQASQLAPTMGRLQAEMLGPNIEREIELLVEHGQMPQLPQELIEANGDYSVIYTSPLAKSLYADDVAGFMRWYEMLQQADAAVVAAGGTELPSDWANLDVAAPEIADYMSVRTAWVNDTKAVNIVRKVRSDAQQKQALLKQAPAGASIVNSAMKSGTGSAGVQGVPN